MNMRNHATKYDIYGLEMQYMSQIKPKLVNLSIIRSY